MKNIAEIKQKEIVYDELLANFLQWVDLHTYLLDCVRYFDKDYDYANRDQETNYTQLAQIFLNLQHEN